MEKPLKPIPTDCCGSGCEKCIYEIYEEHLEKYKKWKKQRSLLKKECEDDRL